MCAVPSLRARYARTGGVPYAPSVPIGARGGVEGHTPILSLPCDVTASAVTLGSSFSFFQSSQPMPSALSSSPTRLAVLSSMERGWLVYLAISADICS